MTKRSSSGKYVLLLLYVAILKASATTVPHFTSGPMVQAYSTRVGVTLVSSQSGHASCIAVLDGAAAPISYASGFNVSIQTAGARVSVNITVLKAAHSTTSTAIWSIPEYALHRQTS